MNKEVNSVLRPERGSDAELRSDHNNNKMRGKSSAPRGIFAAAALLTLLALSPWAILSGCSSEKTKTGAETVRINEVMSSNSYFAPLPDGSCYDWIEFYNPAEQSVDLKGFRLSDNPDKPAKWRISQSLVIEPRGYAVIYLSGLDKVDEYGNFHTNFKLSSKGETLVFSAKNGALLQQIDIPVCAQKNVSYGIDERNETEGFVWMAEPSPGRACTGSTSKDSGGLVFSGEAVMINEYMTRNTFVCYDRDGEYPDWIELYNPSEEEVSLSGCALSDEGDEGKAKWFFPAGTVIEPHGYLLVFCSGKTTADDGELHASFRLGGVDTSIVLYSASGLVMDKMILYDLPENVSCGLDPETLEIRLFSCATPGAANSTYSFEPDEAIYGEPLSSVIISELCSVSSARGTVGEDYIELYNRSSAPVSLSGFGLSDDPEEKKFTFSDDVIPAHGYLLVTCSADAGAANKLTARFALKNSGETVYFTDAEGHLLDRFFSGRQCDGISRGRLLSSLSRCYYFSKPSPGKANPSDYAYLTYSAQPVFSVPAGIAGEGTVVYIEAGDSGEIRYALDGSEPTKSSALYKADEGVTINGTTVLRAASFTEGMLPSAVTTASYFVGTDHTLPIVSVAGDPDGFFSEASGIYSSSTQLTGSGQNFLSDVERRSSVEYFIDGKRAVNFCAGLRIFGAGSRYLDQKSFAVMLREIYGAGTVTYPFFGSDAQTTFSSLVLRQSGQEARTSKVHDELSAFIIRGRVNCDYMDAVPVVLYVNGDYFGIYYIREKLNEDYLIRKYGYTKGKIDIIKSQSEAVAGTMDDYRKMTEFVTRSDLSDSENYRKFCEMVDIDSLIDFWVCTTYLNNNDTGNIKSYRCASDGGKWRWMLFDMDNAMSGFLTGDDSIYGMLLDPEGHGIVDELSNQMMRKLLSNEEFKNKFLSRYCHLMKTTFSAERTVPMLNELAASIESEIPHQYERWGSPSVKLWTRRIEETRSFLEKRQSYVEAFLKRNFRLSDEQFAKIYDAA